MTDTVKDLDYYMANPHEMPDSFLSQQLGDQGEEVSAAPSAEPDEQEETAQDQPAEEVKAAEADEKDEKEPEPEGVASKNGKHVLPYSALVTERERRQAAEKAYQELSERIKALEGSKTNDEPQQHKAQEQSISDADLERMIEDFPQIGGPVKALLGQVKALESQLNEVKQIELSRQEQEAQRVTMTVQEAIEATPQLFYWQNQSPEMFDIAVSFDNQIKADPRNQSLSLQERFSKVVAAVEAVYGKTELPAEYAPKAPPASESVDTLASKAKEKIAQAERKSTPRTISDIPGGIPPAASQEEAMGDMSATELGAMLMKMTPQQVSELLTRVG